MVQEKVKPLINTLKSLIGLSGRQRKFSNDRVLSQGLEEREGYVLSQSLEEKGLKSAEEFIAKYADLNCLVCAARPGGKNPSLYNVLKQELEKKGFEVSTVMIKSNQTESFYKDKATDVYNHLELA